ncbi:MAG: HD-like signal output (HDOD) protein, partial [Candidatus Paceibacteria bacterium]
TSCGERIVRRWGFPDSFVQGIRYHHDPLEAGDYHDLCCVAEAAEAITTIALHDTGVSMLDRSLTSPLSKHSLAATEMLKLLNLVREDLVDTDLALT